MEIVPHIQSLTLGIPNGTMRPEMVYVSGPPGIESNSGSAQLMAWLDDDYRHIVIGVATIAAAPGRGMIGFDAEDGRTVHALFGRVTIFNPGVGARAVGWDGVGSPYGSGLAGDPFYWSRYPGGPAGNSGVAFKVFVDWGDGTSDTPDLSAAVDGDLFPHTYASDGTYDVRVGAAFVATNDGSYRFLPGAGALITPAQTITVAATPPPPGP